MSTLKVAQELPTEISNCVSHLILQKELEKLHVAADRTWKNYTVTPMRDNATRDVYGVHHAPEILTFLLCLRYPCYHSFSVFAFVF